MRFSRTPRLKVTEPSKAKTKTNEAFFAAVAKGTKPDARRMSLLLVGGSDSASFAVRHAQATLRFDKLPSSWSHAAVILTWNGKAEDAVGAEVHLEPVDRSKHVPERNGVTLFRLSRYLDTQLYPNLCVATLRLPPRQDKGDPKEGILAAILSPNRERIRYPFWDWLGVWARYVYNPTSSSNPLTEGMPWPGAAFCQYAFEAAGVDLAPGATAPNACPELLWSTLLYWHDRLPGGAQSSSVNSPSRSKAPSLQAFCVIRDGGGARRAALSGDLREDFEAMLGSRKDTNR